MFFDCHTHTFNSHDSQCDPMDSCRQALTLGLGGIAFTDHCDVEFLGEKTQFQKEGKMVFDLIDQSLADALRCRNQFENENFQVLCGVEMGEAIWHLEESQRYLQERPFDVVIGSVHGVRFGEPYSVIRFDTFSPLQLEAYLTGYFEDMNETLDRCDFDILAHLTCPLRYMIGKYGCQVDLKPHITVIRSILKKAIAQNRCLELNTSNSIVGVNPWMREEKAFFMPDLEILKEYLDLGGVRISLGSDAHQASHVAKGFEVAKQGLLDLGMKQCYYFRERKAIAYDL